MFLARAVKSRSEERDFTAKCNVQKWWPPSPVDSAAVVYNGRSILRSTEGDSTIEVPKTDSDHPIGIIDWYTLSGLYTLLVLFASSTVAHYWTSVTTIGNLRL